MSPTSTEVTDDDVRTAAREANEAAALVGALRNRVADGDPDVTPAQITQARELAEFAELRAQATAKREAAYRERVRLAATEKLRDAIRTSEGVTGAHLTNLGDAAKAALLQFHGALVQRNEQLDQWRTEIQRLGVPEHANPLVPPTEHGNLGHGPGQIIAGDLRLKSLDAGHMLSLLVGEFIAESQQVFTPRPVESGTVAEVLKAADSAPAVPAGARHYFTTGGSVLTLDREPTDAERRGIEREITQREAWGQ